MKPSHFRPSNGWALFYIGIDVIIVTLSLWLSSQANLLSWVLGQLLMAVFCWHCFVNMHSCGHYSFFKGKTLNHIYGNFCSTVTWLSFPSWKLIHGLHHKWTGNLVMDPTMSPPEKRIQSKWLNKTVNLMWKFWLPIVSIAFNFSVFCNLKHIFKYTNDKKEKIYIGVTTVIAIGIHFLMMILISQLYFTYFFVGFCIYLSTSDVIILSNHAQIDMPFSESSRTSSLQQGHLARDLIVPAWIERWVLYGFNKHGLHHVKPALPFYYYESIDYQSTCFCHWTEWVSHTKKMGLQDVFFKNTFGPKKQVASL